MKLDWLVMLRVKRMKSAGVKVSAGVYAAIQRGNWAREAREWATAAAAYQAAVSLQPTLHHVWIQLGHTLKEDGRIPDAQAAYEEAVRLRPQDGEARMLLAHLHKDSGDRLVAVRYLAALIESGIEADEAARALTEMVEPLASFSTSQIRGILQEDDLLSVTPQSKKMETSDDVPVDTGGNDRCIDVIGAAHGLVERIGSETGEALSYQPISSPNHQLVFDISDLISHFQHHRLSTGIQRVQIEVLAAGLKACSHDIKICCLVDGRDHWVELPVHRFLKLAYFSGSGSEADWQIIRGGSFLHLALDEPYTLPRRATLINLGTSWWIPDYSQLIREAKGIKEFQYVTIIYDLIPIVMPQYCVPGLAEDYMRWIIDTLQYADGYIAISDSTKHDLLMTAAQLHRGLSPDLVEVVPLDADFRQTIMAPLPTIILRTWQLEDVPFALFVSTIEVRKNHNLAFDAWAALITLYGRERLPRLVCVGRNGWLNDQAFARLAADKELRAHVTIIHEASDGELALLYQSCQFTIFPSYYEGWGLPVTESLCYGRVPIVADNSSLTEAGGEFALMFESDSIPALVAAVEVVAFDADWRKAREKLIAEKFKPRQWGDIFQQIGNAVTRLSNRDRGHAEPD